MSPRVIVPLALAVLLAACGTAGGMETPEEAAAEYVAALEANDAGRLRRLVDADHDPTNEIPQRLERLGKGRLVVEHTTIDVTASDHSKRVTFTGTLNGEPFSEVLWLRRHYDRWYVALGPYRNPLPILTGGIRGT